MSPPIPRPQPGERYMVSQADITRIEDKLDEVGDAIKKLILVEERQLNQSRDIQRLEVKVSAMEAKLEKNEKEIDRWQQRVLTFGFVMSVLWSIVIVVSKYIPFFPS